MSTKTCLLPLILLLASGLESNIHAQETQRKKHTVAIAPFGLIAGNYNKIRIRYEYRTTHNLAFGTDFKYYFPKVYPGYQILPFAKLYLEQPQETSFYFYATGVIGANKGLPPDDQKYYDCYGGGGGIGFQFILGRNQSTIIDLALGFKFVDTNADFSNANLSDYDDYYIIGPASIVDGIIGLGFLF